MDEMIFLVEGNALRPLPERPLRQGLFGKTLEDALQHLIERFPEVIPGAQMAPGDPDPPRFVLLERESGIGSWSVDHLLADQFGVVTLIEAKLIANPESRRAVIGQILDYAASARMAWAGGRLRERAEGYWSRRGRSLNDEVTFRLGIDADTLFARIEHRLEDGEMRLVVAADELSPEVVRVLEYLNVEARNLEVYGLELRCFQGEGDRLVLVPKLVGRSQAVADRKAATTVTRTWSAETLDEELEKDGGVRKLFEWARGRGFFVSTTTQTPTFSLRSPSGRKLASISRDGTAWLYLTPNMFLDAKSRIVLIRELQAAGWLDPSLGEDDPITSKKLRRSLLSASNEEISALQGAVEKSHTNAAASS